MGGLPWCLSTTVGRGDGTGRHRTVLQRPCRVQMVGWELLERAVLEVKFQVKVQIRGVHDPSQEAFPAFSPCPLTRRIGAS